MEKVKDEGNEALYDKLDSAYATDDDSSEVTLCHNNSHQKTYETVFHFMLLYVNSSMYRWRMERRKMRHISRPIIAKMIVKLKVKLKMIICILPYEEFASRS